MNFGDETYTLLSNFLDAPEASDELAGRQSVPMVAFWTGMTTMANCNLGDMRLARP